jgi:hypothetical protein
VISRRQFGKQTFTNHKSPITNQQSAINNQKSCFHSGSSELKHVIYTSTAPWLALVTMRA